jgi:hypothetical protein
VWGGEAPTMPTAYALTKPHPFLLLIQYYVSSLPVPGHGGLGGVEAEGGDREHHRSRGHGKLKRHVQEIGGDGEGDMIMVMHLMPIRRDEQEGLTMVLTVLAALDPPVCWPPFGDDKRDDSCDRIPS